MLSDPEIELDGAQREHKDCYREPKRDRTAQRQPQFLYHVAHFAGTTAPLLAQSIA
ncbi:hypothetical protein MA5S1212_3068 [Mycobacteroides abscessus 5S-1212]|uniref:Uncharacterized protein n=1 Tax=Mycobacteroides abscessus subsp. bolletii 1513 TaxID=1299321 RepID=X8DJG3_9MYCO|nr:hypothetical protein MA5S1212_3068 [Mycobacteroides abscessus 5S-1212]EUA67853.1 hypothetical protein I540_4690 [Mycobacteroides abscessus subsp. bolletii 1513]